MTTNTLIGTAAYLISALLLFLLIRRLRHSLLLFSVLLLPGTLAHELAHLLVGVLLNAKPCSLTIWPKRIGNGYQLGAVSFRHIRWYNAFFVGLAPLLLLPMALLLTIWRVQSWSHLQVFELVWWYLVAVILGASLPSRQDLQVVWHFSWHMVLLSLAGLAYVLLQFLR